MGYFINLKYLKNLVMNGVFYKIKKIPEEFGYEGGILQI